MRKSVLFLALAAVVAANAAYFLLMPDWSAEEAEPPAPPAAAAPAAEPPPLETLGHGARPPTPEELEEEAHYNDAQVAQANTQIHSQQTEERITGAEQLSAFPTPEAEQILSDALALDFEPEVRKAAAQSLSAFKNPTEKTRSALLAALGDDDEEVQIRALNTLLGIAAKWENHSPQMKKLRADLAAQAASGRTKPPVREAIRAFLKDLEAASAAGQ